MDKLIQFRASKSASTKIDTENRIIYDVIMCSVGPAKGHGVHLEQEFIDNAVSYASKKLKAGVPAEWGHNWEGMGKQLGMYKNIRVVGGDMVGDLHIYHSADISPTHPGMGEYLFSIALEDHTRVNSSIKFYEDGYYQRDKNGTKIKVWYWDKENGWIRPFKEYGKVFVEFKELIGCDIVSKGATTSTLFDSNTMYHKFQDIVNDPKFIPFLESNYEDMPQLSEFFADKFDDSMFAKMKRFFSKESTTTQTSINHKSKDMSTETTEKKTTETVEFSSGEKAIMDAVTALSTRVESLEKKPTPEVKPEDKKVEFSNGEKAIMESIKALSTRVGKLEDAPAAEEIGGPTETTDLSNGTKSWMKIGIHDRARKMGFGK